MLSREDNELLSRVGPGTPMGELFRRFWLPALIPEELSGPDCDPVRLRLLCLLYTSPSPRDATLSRMPSSA